MTKTVMGQLTVMQDPVADALDDMAALSMIWASNRERGRMPDGIRQAMLLVAREALVRADMVQVGDLCGTATSARYSGTDPLNEDSKHDHKNTTS